MLGGDRQIMQSIMTLLGGLALMPMVELVYRPLFSAEWTKIKYVDRV
jgi:hypothetical protein